MRPLNIIYAVPPTIPDGRLPNIEPNKPTEKADAQLKLCYKLQPFVAVRYVRFCHGQPLQYCHGGKWTVRFFHSYSEDRDVLSATGSTSSVCKYKSWTEKLISQWAAVKKKKKMCTQ